MSTHLRFGDDRRRSSSRRSDTADAGLDLGIVYLSPPHTPDVLDELAAAPRAAARLMAAPTPRAQTQRVQPAALRSTHVGQIG